MSRPGLALGWQWAGSSLTSASGPPPGATMSSPAPVRVADGAEHLGDLRARRGGVELEAEVDDLGAAAGGVADALPDRGRVAQSVRVEHTNRHHPGAVGQAGGVP